MVDSYLRKIDDNINNLENSIQISSILLKLKEHDEKLNDNSNLEKIDANITDIKQNQKDIENNLEKINTIESDITYSIKKNIILDKKYPIENFSENRSNNVEIFKINLDTQFSDDGILKINAKYNYTDNTNFSHVYKFL